MYQLITWGRTKYELVKFVDDTGNEEIAITRRNIIIKEKLYDFVNQSQKKKCGTKHMVSIFSVTFTDLSYCRNLDMGDAFKFSSLYSSFLWNIITVAFNVLLQA